MYSNKDRLGRRGFTLVELMVSVVLGAILIGAVLNFVSGQTRIASAQSGREEVQQNARGALEMVASDLRGAISAGVERGDADAIELMLPRRWGAVCTQPGPTRTIVVFPDVVGQPAPTSGVDMGLLMRQNELPGSAWRPALPTRATVTGVTLLGDDACAAASVMGDVAVYQLDGANHPFMTAGARVALYQRVRYAVQQSRGEPWIHRSNGMTDANTYSMQPLAGPVDADGGGISFTYFTGTPPVELLAAPGAGAPAAGLTQVRLRVRMKSRQGGSSTSQVEFDSATVQIRNDN